MEGAKTGENTRTRFWPKPSQRLANQRATITIPALWDGCDENQKIRMKAFEEKYPESTLAIGEDAVRVSAEKWNKKHPDSPVPIDELIAKSKNPPADGK
jgi:hypothetical protein